MNPGQELPVGTGHQQGEPCGSGRGQCRTEAGQIVQCCALNGALCESDVQSDVLGQEEAEGQLLSRTECQNVCKLGDGWIILVPGPAAFQPELAGFLETLVGSVLVFVLVPDGPGRLGQAVRRGHDVGFCVLLYAGCGPC